MFNVENPNATMILIIKPVKIHLFLMRIDDDS